MSANQHRPGSLLLATLLVLSLFLHLALMGLPLRLPTPPSDTDIRPLTIDLRPRPQDSPPASLEPPARQETPPQAQALPLPELVPEEAPAASPEPEETPPPQPAPRQPPAITDAGQLRMQILDSARRLGTQAEESPDSEATEFGSIPRLPSSPGWLNQYTGQVAPSLERWQSADGAHNTRIVTPSGQVICSRIRPPTTQEIFNPWMSAAVPMLRDCGRERPEAMDPSDPWLRAPNR